MSNRSAELLREIQGHAIERAHRALLWPLASFVPGLALALLAGVIGALVALLFSTAVTLGIMLVSGRIITRAMAQASCIYAVQSRVAVFELREWHVVGGEA